MRQQLIAELAFDDPVANAVQIIGGRQARQSVCKSIRRGLELDEHEDVWPAAVGQSAVAEANLPRYVAEPPAVGVVEILGRYMLGRDVLVGWTIASV